MLYIDYDDNHPPKILYQQKEN